MATEHQYRHLDYSRNEIRLVVLTPSRSFKSKISCKLIYRSLDAKIPFEALSYTWGDASSRQLISLDGCEFSVAANLGIALRYLRYPEDTRYIWIDALCINQDDVSERNQQVTKMQDIYRRAVKVVVWLGPASQNSDAAFTFLAEASSKKREIEDWLPKVWYTPARSSCWKAIYDIANRDYWKRVWIVQEIFFACSVVVRCGFRCLHWSDFIFLLRTITRQPQLLADMETLMKHLAENTDSVETSLIRPSILESIHLATSIERFRQTVQDGKNPPLALLLVTYRESLSTDRRDKVFGIAGMTEQYSDERALKIDYSLSERETYIETTRCLIERGKRSSAGPLNIVCCSLPQFSDGTLPSWVPDWSLPPKPKWSRGLGTMNYFYKANGASPPNFTFEIDGSILVVQGVETATICHVGEMAVPFSELPLMDVMDVLSADDGELLKATVHAAAKLAMSDSQYMPQSQIPLDTRREQFARTLLCNRIKHAMDISFGPPTEENISELCKEIAGFDSTETERNETIEIKGSSYLLLLATVAGNLLKYRFCVSSAGSFLMAPSTTRIGDIVCVLFGCDIPIVLRKLAENHYTFVGECYSHGIMEGEAMGDLANGKYKAKSFRIH